MTDPALIVAAKDARDVLAIILREASPDTRRFPYVTVLPAFIECRAGVVLRALHDAIPHRCPTPVAEMSSVELLQHEQNHEAAMDEDNARRAAINDDSDADWKDAQPEDER